MDTCYTEKELEFKSAILYILNRIEINPNDKDLITKIEIIYKHLGQDLKLINKDC